MTTTPTDSALAELRIGPAGWSYADWEGVVYPRPRPRDFHPVSHLGRSCDAIEINSSFYAHSNPRHAERWRSLVEELPRFRFTAKLGQVFTHAEPLEAAAFEAERAAFLAGLRPLGDRLACLLVQFPLSLGDSPPARDRIARIREAFGGFELVLELRHRTWFERGALEFLERSGTSLAAIDLPASEHHPPPDAPTLGPVGYLRLHGRNAAAWFDPRSGRDQRYDWLYSPAELEPIAERARRIAARSDSTFVITNNHFAGKAVANALDLTHLLLGSRPPAPASLASKYSHLHAIASIEGQQTLF